MNYVWIVEMFNPERQRYEHTVGCGIDREQGRQKMNAWRTRNKFDDFRLRKYFAKEPT